MSPRDNPGLVLPPHNMELEQGLLGALLVDNRGLEKIPFTKPEHFFVAAHQRIFTAIAGFIDAGRKASPVALKNHFETDDDLKDVGGAVYLAELAGNVLSTINTVEYAKELKELFIRRALIEVGEKIINQSRNFDLANRGNALADAEALITGLDDKKETKTFTATEAIGEAFRWMEGIRKGELKPILTGFSRLNEKIGGLFPGRLYILGARPGMGKTALGLNIADYVAEILPTVFLSLEMTAQEIGMRLAASRAGVSMNSQQGADLDMHEIVAMQDAMSQKSSLTIEDSSGVDIHTLKSLARRHGRRHGMYALFVDYLGLINPDRKIQNKVHQIEDITMNLKMLAKELNIPIVLLCQLSRAVEMRDDKRPNLSDLRDSGSIEQDADVVMFIYREEYYADRNPPVKTAREKGEVFQARLDDWHQKQEAAKGKAEIIIAKNRQGKTGCVTVNFSGHQQKFFD